MSGTSDLVQKVVENPEALSLSDMLTLMVMTLVIFALIILAFLYCRENNLGLEKILTGLFVKLPKFIHLVFSMVLVVLLSIILYVMSLGLVNIKIEAEFLGKGDIPAWPKPLGRAIKFIFESIAKLLLIILGLFGVITEEVLYKKILKPVGYIILALSMHLKTLAKRKYNDWLIEPHVAIAKAHMENGGWE
jgi:hypothetical protein